MLRFLWADCHSGEFVNGYAPFFQLQTVCCQQLTFSGMNGNAPFSAWFLHSCNRWCNRWTAMLRFFGHFSAFLAELNGYAPFFEPFSSRFLAQKWMDWTVLLGGNAPFSPMKATRFRQWATKIAKEASKLPLDRICRRNTRLRTIYGMNWGFLKSPMREMAA